MAGNARVGRHGDPGREESVLIAPASVRRVGRRAKKAWLRGPRSLSPQTSRRAETPWSNGPLYRRGPFTDDHPPHGRIKLPRLLRGRRCWRRRRFGIGLGCKRCVVGQGRRVILGQLHANQQSVRPRRGVEADRAFVVIVLRDTERELVAVEGIDALQDRVHLGGYIDLTRRLGWVETVGVDSAFLGPGINDRERTRSKTDPAVLREPSANQFRAQLLAVIDNRGDVPVAREEVTNLE